MTCDWIGELQVLLKQAHARCIKELKGRQDLSQHAPAALKRLQQVLKTWAPCRTREVLHHKQIWLAKHPYNTIFTHISRIFRWNWNIQYYNRVTLLIKRLALVDYPYYMHVLRKYEEISYDCIHVVDISSNKGILIKTVLMMRLLNNDLWYSGCGV